MNEGSLLFQPSNLGLFDILKYFIFGMEPGQENWMEGITVYVVLSWISSSAMVIGGVLPYVPQYIEIKKTGNADGFSLYVCLSLLIANILRILFWFGNQYETPLLVQSIVMNLSMLAIVQLCVQVKNSKQIIRGKDKLFLDFERKYFWKWTDFRSYVEFIAAFTLTASLLTYIFLDNTYYVEILGFTSLLIEAMLGTPQFYDNYLYKSTYGMSKTMVFLWLLGDSFKTFYFILRNSPLQFSVCGSLQIAVDLAILSQTVWYGSSHGKRKGVNVSK